MVYTCSDVANDIIVIADKTICRECGRRNDCWCEDEVDLWNLTICVSRALRNSVDD